MTKNQEMAGCFVLEELDQLEGVVYAQMVQCVVAAHDKAADVDVNPHDAAMEAIAEKGLR